ncbi:MULTISPECIES: DUF397 domain-containing protein [unclassified Streptomyces]|uniref:DUF397 domain-containing protein n=1 Tax=unclassified Streptomyces TaxID=2593676 RepID=UPI000DD4F5AD|nr:MULTISPECIES: DUF397 domain-containing protein [unclassified Streptomyces]QZZ27856.1 DUF397 domain-containing protein [Streptomyces sp. ST1015]
MPVFQFVKSSYSTASNDCVEVARNIPHTIAVRDSKAPAGPLLTLTPTTWRAFIRSPWTR